MSRYLILLPAPEAEWADLPPEEHEKGHAVPRAVPRGPARPEGTPSWSPVRSSPSDAGHVDATRRRRASALVTDGPFSETAEQVVGFYLVDSDDEADLRAACQRFAARGEHIEFRRMAE